MTNEEAIKKLIVEFKRLKARQTMLERRLEDYFNCKPSQDVPTEFGESRIPRTKTSNK